MGYKTRSTKKLSTAPAEYCAGCAKEITMNYDDCAVEIRLGILSPRPRKSEFIPQRRWGIMHPECFSLAIGSSDGL